MATVVSTGSARKPSGLARYVPILYWFPRYNRAWLVSDLVAGLSVWALMVPQSLGYADISGVPVQYGLYAAAIALLLYAVFASSRHVVTGPSSTTAAVSGAAVLAVTTNGSPEAIQLTALIVVLAGLMYLGIGLFKMGWISNFLAESVLAGFIFGIGIDVVVGQLSKITGSPESGSNTWQKFFSWLQGLPQTNVPTLILGGLLLVMLILLKLYAPKVPGALLAMVIGIAAGYILPLASMGVALQGPVPSGLPSLALPDLSLLWQYLPTVLPAAIGVLLIGFSESLAAAREYSAKFHYDIDVNQEMLAQGMANVGSGLFQGITVDGSLSKSSLNAQSGAKSELASVFQGSFVVLTLLFLAPLFAYLPKAALGAVVIQAVAFGLWKIPDMRRLWRLARNEFWVALLALLGVLTFGTLAGVFIGVTLSLLLFIWHGSHPGIPVLGRLPATNEYRSIESHPDDEIYPGLVILRFDGALFFATAASLRTRIRELTTDVQPPVRAVILDMESTNGVDLEGSDELAKVARELQEGGVALYLARVKQSVQQTLERDGAFDVIDRNHVCGHVHQAVTDVLTSI